MKSLLFNPLTSLWSSSVRIAAPLFAVLLLVPASKAHGDQDRDGDRHGNRPPNLPAELRVPAGSVLQFHATGVGTQVYVWTQSATDPTQFSWVFKTPHAVLFQDGEGIVSIHFGGPSWEANDGSKVVGSLVAHVAVTPDDIQWLLLSAASNEGVGVFAETTFIQRLNTSGGLAPTDPGSFVGQEVSVPYSSEYFFYRAN